MRSLLCKLFLFLLFSLSLSSSEIDILLVDAYNYKFHSGSSDIVDKIECNFSEDDPLCKCIMELSYYNSLITNPDFLLASQFIGNKHCYVEFRLSNLYDIINNLWVEKIKAITKENALNIQYKKSIEYESSTGYYFGYTKPDYKVEIFNQSGKMVRKLLSPFYWDGTDKNGDYITSGEYKIITPDSTFYIGVTTNYLNYICSEVEFIDEIDTLIEKK